MDCRVAEYQNSVDRAAICQLMQHYAGDPMGGGEPLDESVIAQLPDALSKIAGAVTVLCFEREQPIGLINAFEGFSTFKCRPLLNVHDVVVHRDYRGRGISQQMLAVVEQVAVERNCCKITLEVLEGNRPARAAYQRFGFAAYQLDPEMGDALFYEKVLE